jgi:hypothetical protein
MHSSVSPLTESSSSHTATAPGPDLVIVYETLSAALWGSETVMNLFRQIKDCPAPRVSAWPFSSIENFGIRGHATNNAFSSDLLVIAASSAHRLLPAYLEQWVETCFAMPRRSPCAIAALLRKASIPDGPDSPRLQFLQRLAQANGCGFFAPFVEPALALTDPDSDGIASGKMSAPFYEKLFETRMAS